MALPNKINRKLIGEDDYALANEMAGKGGGAKKAKAKTDNELSDKQLAEHMSKLKIGEIYTIYDDEGYDYEVELVSLNKTSKRAKVMYDDDSVQEVAVAALIRDWLVDEEEESDNEEVEERIPIAKAQHAAIIGKGGATVKELQERIGAKISLPGKDSKSDIITFKGTREQVKKAKEEVKKLAADSELNSVRDRQGRLKNDEKSQMAFPSLTTQTPVTIEVDIPKWTHPQIIGKQGKNLEEIKNMAGQAYEGDYAWSASLIELRVPRREEDDTRVVIIAPQQLAENTLEALLQFLEHRKLRNEVAGIYYPRGKDGLDEPTRKPGPTSKMSVEQAFAAHAEPQVAPTPPPKAEPEVVEVAQGGCISAEVLAHESLGKRERKRRHE